MCLVRLRAGVHVRVHLLAARCCLPTTHSSVVSLGTRDKSMRGTLKSDEGGSCDDDDDDDNDDDDDELALLSSSPAALW